LIETRLTLLDDPAGTRVQTAVVAGGHAWTPAVSELGRRFVAALR
jgi:hypothetical protein